MRSIPIKWQALGLLALVMPLSALAQATRDGVLDDEIVLASPFYMAAGYDNKSYSDLADIRPAMDRPMLPPRGGPGAGMPPPPGDGMPPLVPPDLNLSDAQKDKLFDIVYPLEPKFRELSRTIRNSMTALHALASSDSYDEAKARAIADAYARATADMSLLRTRVEHQVYGMLTPEQRKVAEACRDRPGPGRMPGGMDRPPPPPFD